MQAKWISPKIIVGNVAKGDYYHPRPDTVEEVGEELEKGNSVLLASPRRVGKSSVMIDMSNNKRESYPCVFETKQGIQPAAEFYKRIYGLIVKCMKPHLKAFAWITEIWKEHKIDELSIEGTVKLKDGTVNYLNEINRLLPKLNNKELKIVLLSAQKSR
jgi:hypothetical protein